MNILELKRKLLPMSGPQMSMGGGGSSGGGGGTQIQELPEWARPYAKDTLEKGAALTEKPYQSYGGDRFAGFSPMQQQAQQGAANMQTSQGTNAGMGVAGLAALGGLNQDYNGMQARSQNFGGRSAAQYMNPYVEQAMAPQLREAQRSSDIMGQQNAAKAVGQGAFGGSRSGLVEAERQRNLAMQQGDIRAQGLNTAYNNAQNQFNADQTRNMQAQQMNIGQQQFGANLGLQGLNTALQGANTLGQLGGQQFQQGMDINKLQNAYGGQQQALQQQGLSQAYEDFQNQNNYGYKQLGFMSDLIRGLPLGQQTATQMYTPNPSAAQNVAALGAGAYGLSKFMAEGGMAYADGGYVPGYSGENGSVVSSDVDSEENVAAIVHTLSDQDLQKAAQAAQARGDTDQLDAIKSEMAMRASLKNGLASAVTPQMAAAGGLMDSYAGGGVLAFNSRGEVDSDAESNDRERYIESKGDPAVYGSFGKFGMDQLERLKNLKAFESLKPAERAALEQQAFESINRFGGEDPYAPMAERIKGLEEAATKNYERAQGASILAAIPKILEGGNAARGIAGGLGAYGTQIEQADRAHAAEKRGLAGINFNLSDAKRKERMAAGREALANVKDREANRLAAHTAERADIVAGITGAGKFAQAYRPVGGSGGGAGKGPKMNEQLVAAEIAYENDPTPENLSTVKAVRRAVDRAKTSDAGPNRTATANAANDLKRQKMVEDALEVLVYTPDYLKATKAQQKAMRAEESARVAKLPIPEVIDLDNKAKGGIISPIKLD